MPLINTKFVTGFQPPFLRHPSFESACPPFFKFLFSLPSFLFCPLLRYFRQFSHPHTDNLLPAFIHSLHLVAEKWGARTMKHHHEKGPVDGIDNCTVNVVLTEANSTICFIISTQFLNYANQ